MTEIKSIEQWNALAAEFRAVGYTLYQWQYRIYDPEGFQARFWALGRPLVELVTHSNDVYNAIIAYRPE